MSTLVIVRCDVCGHTGRYKTRALADHHFPRHSCDKWLANADAVQAAITREATIDRTPKPCPHPDANHQHGTYVTYTLDRCRCLPCVAACSQYNANLARRHAYGQAPYTDADPVRDHVNELRAAGIGLKTIATRAGVSHGALSKLLYGYTRPDGTRRPPSKRIHTSTATRILAVQPTAATDVAAAGARLDATGARRRLQALATLGWSVQRLADHAGLNRQRFDWVLRGRPAKAATVRAIRDLYDELWDTPAPTATKTDKIAASRTRRRAARAGYAPPLAWDDDTIDNPDARPQHDAPTPILTPGRRGVDLDEWLFLVRTGEHTTRAAERLGVTLNAVERAATRHGRDDVLDAIYPNRPRTKELAAS